MSARKEPRHALGRDGVRGGRRLQAQQLTLVRR